VISVSCGQNNFAAGGEGRFQAFTQVSVGKGATSLPESRRGGTIIAHRVSRELRIDAARSDQQWQSADPIRFAADWQGQNRDPGLETEVRLLWSPATLYLRFVCRYRDLFVFGDSDANGRRHQLWDRDVAEAFLQTPDCIAKLQGFSVPESQKSPARPYAFYKEIEIAPNGMWIDLNISPAGLADLRSSLARSVYVNEREGVWIAELAVPMPSLTSNFDPEKIWRANFYRVEGRAEPRCYMAWQPTLTPQPNFHVPEKFGFLRFLG